MFDYGNGSNEVYITSDDSEKKWFHCLNLSKFRYTITLIYLKIQHFKIIFFELYAFHRKATNRKIVKSSTACDKRAEQSAAMQRKLTRIVASDFLCWVPVCIMGFLQLSGNETEQIYGFFF